MHGIHAGEGIHTHVRRLRMSPLLARRPRQDMEGWMDEMMQDREASGKVWRGVLNLDELVMVVLVVVVVVLEAI